MNAYFGFASLSALLAVATLAGCNDVPLAPGADRIVVTRNAGDVTSCTPVGNIDSRIQGRFDDPLDVNHVTMKEVQNQAVGLGGNVVLDTTPSAGPTMGVIYRCGSDSAAKK